MFFFCLYTGNLPEESFVSGQVPSASEEPFSIQPTTVSIPVTSFEDTSLVSSPRAEQIEEQLSSFEFVTNNLQSSEPPHISDHFAFSGEEKITVATNQPLSQQGKINLFNVLQRLLKTFF